MGAWVENNACSSESSSCLPKSTFLCITLQSLSRQAVLRRLVDLTEQSSLLHPHIGLLMALPWQGGCYASTGTCMTGLLQSVCLPWSQGQSLYSSVDRVLWVKFFCLVLGSVITPSPGPSLNSGEGRCLLSIQHSCESERISNSQGLVELLTGYWIPFPMLYLCSFAMTESFKSSETTQNTNNGKYTHLDPPGTGLAKRERKRE